MPTRCAVETISIQVRVGSLPLVSTQRTSSSRISAAVPGSEPRPASRALIRKSSIDRPVRAVPLTISIGENAWTCISGTRCFTARDQVEVRRRRQLGVDAALHADLGRAEVPRLLGAVGDLVEGQRVGVGVGPPLGERAEPAADVADVGEVDVAVDDVGHLVADGLAAQLVGEPDHLVAAGRPRRSSGSARARRRGCRGPSRRRARHSRSRSADRPRVEPVETVRSRRPQRPCTASQSPYTVEKSLRRSSVRPSVSTASNRSVRPDRLAKPPSGSCQGSPVGRTPGIGETVRSGQRGDVAGDPGVEPRLAALERPTTYSGCTVSRAASSKPHSAVISRSRSSEGHGRSGLTWSGVSGETPPQSSMPASSSARHSVEVDQVRRRLDPRLRAEHEPGDRDGGAVLVEAEVVDVAHRGVGLGPEVLDDDLLHRAEGARRTRAARRSSRPARCSVSPMPTSSPVVNGIDEPAGVLEHPQPDLGVLVGRAVVRLALGLEQPPRGGLEHHPHRRRDRLEPVQLLPRHHAGVEVRQQPGLLEHPDRHRPHVGERGVVALLVEPRPGLGPAVLGPVAEGEQRLEAARARRPGGRCRGSRRGRGTVAVPGPRSAGPASRRTCSSGTGPGTAW